MEGANHRRHRKRGDAGDRGTIHGRRRSLDNVRTAKRCGKPTIRREVLRVTNAAICRTHLGHQEPRCELLAGLHPLRLSGAFFWCPSAGCIDTPPLPLSSSHEVAGAVPVSSTPPGPSLSISVTKPPISSMTTATESHYSDSDASLIGARSTIVPTSDTGHGSSPSPSISIVNVPQATTPPEEDGSPKTKALPRGALVAMILGGSVFVLLLVGAFWWWRQRDRAARQRTLPAPFDVSYSRSATPVSAGSRLETKRPPFPPAYPTIVRSVVVNTHQSRAQNSAEDRGISARIQGMRRSVDGGVRLAGGRLGRETDLAELEMASQLTLPPLYQEHLSKGGQ
ncbi:hypothetical protein C8Q80DRAFT_447433 [Daedaleopsis nitida]|nr:hypothetical protein C8Q80DRAFT_447433 [Daedaleopsis nitida]